MAIKLRQTVQDHLPKTDQDQYIADVFKEHSISGNLSSVIEATSIVGIGRGYTPDVFKADIVQFMAATNCRSDSNVEWDAFHGLGRPHKKESVTF